MRYLAMVFIIYFSLSSCDKETVTNPRIEVSGTVTDASTSLPLRGTTVELCNYQVHEPLFGVADSQRVVIHQAVTSADGGYGLNVLVDNRRYNIEFHAAGFTSVGRYISAGMGQRFDMSLYK
jgi:hypothetical protein